MDGVISDARHRQHLLRANRWDAFFSECGQDPPLLPAAVLLTSIDPNLTVVLLTARPMRVQPHTLKWLRKHQMRWDLLIMSPPDARGNSQTYKADEVNNLRDYGFDLLYALDDDPRNVEMFTAHNVPCLYIHSGYYER